jgi:choline kinase
MKAVILCAGRGMRLLPLTEETPKCLLHFGPKTLLEYTIESFKESGIDEILLVTGFKEESIRALVKKRGYSEIGFVTNRDYAKTNTAYSLNLALEHMGDDFIQINGDVLFDRTILTDLLEHPAKNCVVVDTAINLNAEEVKVISLNGTISSIGKHLAPDECIGEAIGINKISRDIIPDLKAEFDNLERSGELNHFFEKGFDILAHKKMNFGILVTGKPWAEIDTLDDFNYARNQIYAKLHDKH